MSKQIHLWAFLQGIGFFPTGWRHPRAAPEGVFSMDYYARVAKMVDDARFDAIVFGDQLQSRGAGGRTPARLAMPTLDPVSLLMDGDGSGYRACRPSRHGVHHLQHA